MNYFIAISVVLLFEIVTGAGIGYVMPDPSLSALVAFLWGTVTGPVIFIGMLEFLENR